MEQNLGNSGSDFALGSCGSLVDTAQYLHLPSLGASGGAEGTLLQHFIHSLYNLSDNFRTNGAVRGEQSYSVQTKWGYMVQKHFSHGFIPCCRENWNYVLGRVITTTSFTRTRWIAVSANKMMKERCSRSIKEGRGGISSLLIRFAFCLLERPNGQFLRVLHQRCCADF